MRSDPSPGSGRFVLSMLILIVVVLSVDLATLAKAKPTPANDATATVMWQKVSDDGKKFLEKQYDTAVTEIRLRIEQEHLMFALKFALVGAILYAAVQRILSRKQGNLERTPATALVTWAAVVVAAVVDWRIAGNQSLLSALGEWVRRYETLRLEAHAAGLGWESFLAARLAHPAVRLSGQVLTALLFAVSASVFLTRKTVKNDPVTSLSRTCAIVSIGIMTLTAARFRGPWVMTWAYIVLGLIGVWLVFVLTKLSNEDETARIVS